MAVTCGSGQRIAQAGLSPDSYNRWRRDLPVAVGTRPGGRASINMLSEPRSIRRTEEFHAGGRADFQALSRRRRNPGERVDGKDRDVVRVLVGCDQPAAGGIKAEAP